MRSVVAGKPRVHELAKELGVESKTVLAKLKELGEFVKSASSTVEAPVARRLRASFESPGGAPTASAAPSPPREPPPPRGEAGRQTGEPPFTRPRAAATRGTHGAGGSAGECA